MAKLIIDETRYYNEYAPLYATRCDLPHWSQEHKVAFVTFRLADSLPADKLESLRREYEAIVAAQEARPGDKELEARMIVWHNLWERHLDEGCCSCVLARTDVRQTLTDTLLHFNGSRYVLHSFVIMPNHVHLVVEPKGEWRLQEIMRVMKGFSAHEINALTGGSGKVWQREYYDRIIRSREHYGRVRLYVWRNPRHCAPGTYTYWEAEPL